jgi:hypothetical protein
MADELAKHRVIGILHSLRVLKDAGLVEEETRFANKAVRDVRKRITASAASWYQIGARRGALEVMELILEGKIRVEKKGRTRELVTYVNNVQWETRLKVNVGDEQRVVPKKKYRVAISALGFKPVGKKSDRLFQGAKS